MPTKGANRTTPMSPTHTGWFNNGVNARLEAVYNATAFLRATASAVTFPLATTFSAAITAAGGFLSTLSTAGIGYATGAGGAVTQITTSATGVTLSKPCGVITTVALTTSAAAEEQFTVTNTLVAVTDVIALSTTYAGAGTPMLSVAKVTAGTFDIVITNVHASNALNAVMIINFAIIKTVNA